MTANQGSAFDQERQQGGVGDAEAPTADVGHGQGMGMGMGRAAFDSGEDRGYDQSGHHGGLGSSGGR